MHRLLRWANKREVARELSRRGFDVSGETLNRWVREEREFPAVVERMVLDMYGIGDIAKEPPEPAWLEGLQAKVDAIYARQDTIMARQGSVGTEMAGRVIEALQSPDLAAWAARIGERLAELPSQSDEAFVDQPEGSAPGTGSRRDPEPS